MTELNRIYLEDCLDRIGLIETNSIDAIVTDPPYDLVSVTKRWGKTSIENEPYKQKELEQGGTVFTRKTKGFMGKEWDGTGIAFKTELWRECLRVLKPGGHLLAFGGTRTYHRMACAIEDAGFQPRNMLVWAYGQGFPKSLNIKKQLEKMGNNRANEFDGFGTDLKPAIEPICLARKSLDGTVAENCLKWGVGGLDIDGCRVESSREDKEMLNAKSSKNPTGVKSAFGGGIASMAHEQGRFPANLIHDNSEEVRECFPDAGKGNGKGAYNYAGREYDNKDTSMFNGDKPQAPSNFNDSGSASRFFQHCSLSPDEVKSIIYTAKASKVERNEGCEGLEEKQYSHDGRQKEIENPYQRNKSVATNNHPTVKPIALIEYLIKLVTREGQTVLDPFAGSGTTGVACIRLKRNYILIEKEPEYYEIIKARIAAARPDPARNQTELFKTE